MSSTVDSPTSGTADLTDSPVAPANGAHPGHPGLLAALLGVPLFAALLLTAFVWPASSIAPRDVPIGLSGPSQVVAGIEEQLTADGAFAVTTYGDGNAAEEAISDREIYGAIVVGPQGAEVLTASAGSPVVAQLLTEVARGIGQSQGVTPTVRDVVAADPDDPRGAGLGVMVFPMIVLGLALGAASVLLTTSRAVRFGMLALGSVLGGLTAVLLVQAWLGIIGGDWWINAGVLMLTVGAIASVAAGLGHVIGPPGIGVAAILMVLVGNPLSGASSAPELLAQPWGAIGQGMPPGAGITLLRSAAFFDGAGGSATLWTLVAWLTVGLGLVLLPGRRVPTHA